MPAPLCAATTADALTLQFGWSHRLVTLNCEGLSTQDSLLQPEPSGNCLNWVLGHIIASRQLLLPALGGEPTWSEALTERYGRHSAPVLDASEAVPFEELLSHLTATWEALQVGLASLERADLDAPAPFSTAGRDNETLGSLVTGFAFHEAYHAGQVSPLRRRAGREAAFR